MAPAPIVAAAMAQPYSTKNPTAPPASTAAAPIHALATAPRRPIPSTAPMPVARSPVG